MLNPHYAISNAQALLKRLYRSLVSYFNRQNKELISIEVWAKVLFLRFKKARSQFFSKRKAAEIAQVSYRHVEEMPILLNYAKSPINTVMQEAIQAPVDIEAIIAKVAGIALQPQLQPQSILSSS